MAKIQKPGAKNIPAARKSTPKPVAAAAKPNAKPAIPRLAKPAQPFPEARRAIVPPPPSSRALVDAGKKAKPAASVDTAALLRAVEKLSGDVDKLTTRAAKATRVNVRTSEEILDGIKIDKKDWRAPYHGLSITLRAMYADRKGDFHLTDDGRQATGLLAVPRTNDIGGRGDMMRAAGYVAFHWATNESGEYVSEPMYMTPDEFAQAWIDGVSGE